MRQEEQVRHCETEDGYRNNKYDNKLVIKIFLYCILLPDSRGLLSIQQLVYRNGMLSVG